jgi:dihydrofolate reductase
MTGRGDLALIWAQARGGVIGRAGELPWHLPEDLAHFKRTTAGATVLMGRRTWESLPEAFRPLPGRRNLVVTRRSAWTAPGAEAARSVAEALELAGRQPVWVIGGGELYRATIGFATALEVTEIDLGVDGDTFAPEVGVGWRDESGPWLTSTTGLRYRFRRYGRSEAGGPASSPDHVEWSSATP